MKNLSQSGRILFALATIAFGLIQVLTGDFNKGLFPVQMDLPGRTILVYISGITLLLTGTGLLLKSWRKVAGIILGIVYLSYFIFLHLTKLFSDLYDGGEWSACFETLILTCGAMLAGGRMKTACRFGLATSFIVFAALHFRYRDYIATLIPAWIPAKLFLACFIGIAFLLTSLSFLLNRLIKPAALLLGFMFLLWVFIVHVPRVFTTVKSEPEWTSLFVALAAAGTSLMMSEKIPVKKGSLSEQATR